MVPAESRCRECNGIERVTTQNLKVVRTDLDKGLLMVRGAVPGSKGTWVTIKDSVKKGNMVSLDKSDPSTEQTKLEDDNVNSNGAKE